MSNEDTETEKPSEESRALVHVPQTSDDEPAGPPTLAGMRVSATIHQGRLCVLGMCETPYGAVPLACHFGIDFGADAVLDGPIDLREPQAPGVLDALAKAESHLAMKAKVETYALMIENLVRRARLGDQNAMAMIAAVRVSAKEGVQKANEAFLAINQYISSHPAETEADTAHFGQESNTLAKPVTSAASKLSNGPLLTDARIFEIAEALGPNRAAFLYGCKNYRTPQKIESAQVQWPLAAGALSTGACVGKARAIQAVRRPETRISSFSEMVGWELGE